MCGRARCLGVVLLDTLFCSPKTRKNRQRPSPGQGTMHPSSSETHFQLIGVKAPLILLHSLVNSTGPYNFILDSGATHCLISPQLAATLGIQPESKQEAFGGGGVVQLSHAHVHSIAVGSAKQENTEVAIAQDLERFGAALKMTIDGAIGFNFLKDFLVTLDYQRKVVSFARPSDNDETNHSTSFIPFALTPSEPKSCFRYSRMVRDRFNSSWTPLRAAA